MLPKSTALQLVMALFFLGALELAGGCSTSDSPPYYTALVTDVYKEQTTVEHFTLLYSWEERGETPFLKPYSLAAKEVIYEFTQPIKNMPDRVTVETGHMPFDTLDTLTIELTDTGKRLLLTAKDGRTITADMSFPKTLRKDPASGFGDMKLFVQGLTRKDGVQAEFKLALDFVRQIKIMQKTDK